ncbi:MAG: biotin/lipoyl-containing protein, partial [Verrucomicrobiota bacterium]
MSFEVKIPAVGESITSGLISTWHKNDGETVNAGDALLTLETDKVSTEITAERAGVLHITVQAGQEVKIGEAVATIDESAAGSASKSDQPVAALSSPSAVAPSHTLTATSVPQTPKVEQTSAPAEAPAAAAPAPAASAGKGLSAALVASSSALSLPAESAAPVREGRSTRKRISPLRRKIAAQLVMAQHTAAI